VITRRGFVLAAAAICADRAAAQIEEATPVLVELPYAEFDLNVAVFAAVNTSGYTTCQVQLVDTAGRTVLQSQDWGTEPNVSNAEQLKPTQSSTGKQKLKTRIAMRPTRKKTPSVGMAMTQGEGVDLVHLKQVSKAVRFVKDPAQPPDGHFEVMLTTDASVSVAIWPGEIPQGRPVYQTSISDLPVGRNQIVWKLCENSGRQVKPGRYIALLTSTPTKMGLHPTTMCSYFGVMTAEL
jgi:hypothetical protein